MNTAVIADEELGPEVESTAPEPEELPLGTCIHGKYTVHGVLGHGGFATVYDALHLGLQRNVAIKVLHVRVETPLALIERFHREARISALVRHPNVLEVYDTGVLPDGSPYLVMERMNGETLAAAFARGKLPIAMVFEIGRQLLSALVAIGEASIVHRDLKPENIMLDHPIEGPPLIKLVDFGISKQVAVENAPRLTWQGALIGTPQYMSPEQMSGEPTDARTDLYSLGAVLYEALTGCAPHQCENFSELVVAVLNTPIEPPRKLRRNCPAALEQLVLKALARKPEQRFSSAREMLAELERIANELAVPRGSDAFGAPDTPGLLAAPRAVVARDSGTISKLWPLRVGRASTVQQKGLYAAAALLLALLGAPSLFESNAQRGDPSTGAAIGVTSVVAPTAASMAAAPQALEQAPIAEAPHAAQVAPGEALVEPLLEAEADAPEAAATNSPGARAVANATPQSVRPDEVSGKAMPAPPPPMRVERAAPAKPAAASPTPSPASKAGLDTQRGWDQAMQAALSELVRGRLEAAKARYQEAVRLDPTQPAGFRGLGLVSARLGDHRSAREALRRYLALAPNARDAAMIQARLTSLQ